MALISQLRGLSALALMVVLISACAGGAGVQADNTADNAAGEQAAVSGELVYRQRIALAPGAEINVRLVDVDDGTILGQQNIQPQGRQVPIAFRIAYNADDFTSDHQHLLLATVRDGAGQLHWAADTPIDTFDSSRDDGVRVQLAQASFNAKALIGSPWQLQRIVHADGTIDWAGAEQPSTLEFGDDGRVGGHAACNRFFADYELADAGKLTFGHAGATLMACSDAGLAQAFLQLLDKVQSYAITGDQLRLFADDATLVLTHTTETEASADHRMHSPRAGDGVVFWNKGNNTALSQVDGQTYADCAFDHGQTAAA